MYLKILPAVFALLFTGCGENSNTPVAGDVVSVRVEANQTVFYATQQVQLNAIVSYTEGVPERNATESMGWTPSDGDVASVDGFGVVSGGSSGGDVEITGSYKQFSDSVTLYVHALKSVAISAENNDTNLSQEQTLQLHVLGTFDDNTTLDVTESMTWVLGNAGESNATLEQNGTLYTGDANGTLDINVSRYDVNATMQVNVAP